MSTLGLSTSSDSCSPGWAQHSIVSLPMIDDAFGGKNLLSRSFYYDFCCFAFSLIWHYTLKAYFNFFFFAEASSVKLFPTILHVFLFISIFCNLNFSASCLLAKFVPPKELGDKLR